MMSTKKLSMAEESFQVGDFLKNNNRDFVVINKERINPDEGMACYTLHECRKHRIKKENEKLVSEKLKELQIPFKIVNPPMREEVYNSLSFLQGEESEFQTLQEKTLQENKSFIGIMCPISGKEFHRILKTLGIVIDS